MSTFPDVIQSLHKTTHLSCYLPHHHQTLNAPDLI